MDTRNTDTADPISPAPTGSAVASSSQCSATTRGGTRCKQKAVGEAGLCRVHGMSPAERKAASAAAAARSAEVRSKAVEARRDALEAAQKGLKVLMAERLEARADRVVAVLEEMLDDPDRSVRIRGIQLWLDRVYGRAVQPTRDDTPSVAGDLAALEAMTLDELAQLARGLPTHPEPA